MKRSRLSRQASRRKVERLVRQNPYGDYDRDGVPNISDCQPLNPMRHGIEPNIETRKRLDALPVYFHQGKMKLSDKVHISNDKLAKQNTLRARQKFYSLVKRFPNIISAIESSRNLEMMVFTDNVIHDEFGHATLSEYDDETGYAVVSLADMPYGKHVDPVVYEKSLLNSANTIFHELEHISQFHRWKGRYALAEQMSKSKHGDTPEELMARKVARRSIRKGVGGYDVYMVQHPFMLKPRFRHLLPRAEKRLEKMISVGVSEVFK